MAIICPTVTAETAQEYRQQVALLESFATRIHVDLADGILAPRKLIDVDKIYWPEDMMVDIHMMFQQPQEHLENLISLNPNMVIIHAEAAGNVHGMILELQSSGIKAGVALLPQTDPEDHAQLINAADHILIFGGNFGYQGGQAQLPMLKKISAIRMINPVAEIGWDGGVNIENLPMLLKEGVEIVNVGGYIHHSDDPAAAYQQLADLARL